MSSIMCSNQVIHKLTRRQQCVSSRARQAIGLGNRPELEVKEGDSADFVVFGIPRGASKFGFRHRTSIQELVYDACRERQTIFQGSIANS